MSVELIGGKEFRQRLVALGVRVPDAACPQTCARMAAACHRARGVEGLETSVRDLLAQRDALMPSVKTAIATHLVPALERS